MARKMKMSRPTSRQHPATSRFDYGPPQLKYAKKIAEAQKNRYSRNPRNRQGVRHRREHRRGPQGVSLPGAVLEASAQFGYKGTDLRAMRVCLDVKMKTYSRSVSKTDAKGNLEILVIYVAGFCLLGG